MPLFIYIYIYYYILYVTIHSYILIITILFWVFLLLYREGLPCIIFANWRGFSGGQRDMFDEVLKVGS